MYTAVLMLAMVSSPESIDHGRRNCYCSGYYGCCGGYYGGYYGCCGGYYSGGGYAGGYYGRPYYAGYYTMPYASGYYAPYASGYNYGSSGYMGMDNTGTQTRQSFYMSPEMQRSAIVQVLLPTSQAEVWFDGQATTQRGMERTFVSAPMESKEGKYTIKARWTDENGKTENRTRTVTVERGQPITVDFRQEHQQQQREKLPAPKSGSGD